jgi:hypothetical protein
MAGDAPRTEPERAARRLLPGVPLVESPFASGIFDTPDTDPELRRIAMDLSVKGYAVLDFPDPAFDATAEAIKTALGPRYDFDHWRAVDHPRGEGLRLQNAWRYDAHVKAIAGNAQVLDLLRRLYGRPAAPFQTLNFPVGTQQHTHTDSVHFSCNPERFMCGVWVALEDTDDDNGPLTVWPGSHRWPIYTNEHIGRCVTQMDEPPTQLLYEDMWQALIEASGIEPTVFRAKKGQALIWTANLLHGGAPQRDPARTRWSQVTHYFFEGCAYYTPLLSDTFFGRIAFRKPVNILTGQELPQSYAGRRIPDGVLQGTALDEPPVEDFDAALYLAANPDVKAAGWNAAEHYLAHGRKEKRRLRP